MNSQEMLHPRQDELDCVRDNIKENQIIHVSGQPGVGKSTFLETLAEELSPSYRTRTLHVREGNSPTTLTQQLLYEVRESVGTIRSLLNRASGASIGLGAGPGSVGGGVSFDERTRHIQKLADLSESVKADSPLLLFIDDIHKLSEPDITRGYLQELGSNLGENVHLITAGRLTFEDADLTVDLETFTYEETAQYLRNRYSEIETEVIENVYEKLDGHPYYLGLLTETTDSDTVFELPEEDTRDFIERAYLDSMSEEEEEFIRQSSGLAELDEEICSAVIDDVGRTQARRILNSLSSKAVVTELGRSEDTGDRVFQIHELFQEFLYQQLDDPDEFHRAAFQYYAEKLYDAVEESEAPALEGLVYALMGNVHLREIYNGTLDIQQVRTEVDQLALEDDERLQFMFGYSPYAPIPEGESSALIALELDDYTASIRGRESENQEEELQIEIYCVMMDVFRATSRSNTKFGFDESSLEIYESTIQRIDELEFEDVFDDDEQEAAQLIPDLLTVCVRVAAHRHAESNDEKEEHLSAAFNVLEEYGLNRSAAEEFLSNCRVLAEEYEAGEQAEEMVESQLGEFLSQFDQENATRNTLIRMQSELYEEVVELIKSAFTAMVSESDRLLEFINECGNSLEQADNPFFVAAWYSSCAHVYRMFAPKAKSTRELEEAAQQYAELRIEYEEELDNVIYEIEEFDVQEVSFPDFVGEIAEHEGDRQLME